MTTLASLWSPISHNGRAAGPDLRATPLPVAVAGAGFITGYHLAVLREVGGFEVVGAGRGGAKARQGRTRRLCEQPAAGPARQRRPRPLDVPRAGQHPLRAGPAPACPDCGLAGPGAAGANNARWGARAA